MTPGFDALARALALPIPVFPMIRPRGGGFIFHPGEVDAMAGALERVRALGAHGAVIGALTEAGDIDRDTVMRLRDAAGPTMQLTFHRAFDQVAGRLSNVEVLIDLGVDRILTSGGAPTAWEGRDQLARLVGQARGRIVIMAGGKVTPDNAAALVRATGVRELHFRTTGAAKVGTVRERVG